MVVEKPHAVCIPFPSQGHVNPIMQLAKLLHSRGLHITFVNTEFNHRRLIQSKGPDDAIEGLTDFRFETIPDGLPLSIRDATQDVPSLCTSVQKNCLAPLLDLLLKLNSSSDLPPVSCVVYDSMMSCGLQAANELGIQAIEFWPAAACSFMGYLHFPELIKRRIVPLTDENDISNGYLDTTIDWIPGIKHIQLKDLSTFLRTTDPNDIMLQFFIEESKNWLKGSAIIFNTFDELEQEVLGAIACKFPCIYTMGPLSILGRDLPETESKLMPSSLWKVEMECLKWLDKMEPNSVLYVNFGSIAVMTDQHLREFAWGLANSKHPFLWVIRPDVVMGESAILPQGFIEETKDRSFLASWCPQEQVLLHSSIGGFLTHCGWNSIIESICGGVPILCWPPFADQPMNCRYACTIWEIGMEIDKDVKRDKIERLIKELLEGEKGRKMRNKALELKVKAGEATKLGGSSYSNFDRLISELLQPKESPTEYNLASQIDNERENGRSKTQKVWTVSGKCSSSLEAKSRGHCSLVHSSCLRLLIRDLNSYHHYKRKEVVTFSNDPSFNEWSWKEFPTFFDAFTILKFIQDCNLDVFKQNIHLPSLKYPCTLFTK